MRLRAILFDEEGQATTEYILILAIMVSLALLLLQKVIRPAYDLLKVRLVKQMENTLFPNSGGAFHQFRIRR